jgi:hypothetical protein
MKGKGDLVLLGLLALVGVGIVWSFLSPTLPVARRRTQGGPKLTSSGHAAAPSQDGSPSIVGHLVKLVGTLVGHTDLHGRNLAGHNLVGRDLEAANLSGAVLRNANLRGEDLAGADLTGADLRGAILQRTTLGEADLRRADLRGANLTGADLKGAHYDAFTRWPAGFDPRRHGAVKVP